MRELPPVADLVPHAPPTLALERLLSWSPGFARARLVVREGQLFVQDGRVAGIYLLEYLAQAVAACLGCEAFHADGSVRVGMVVGCRSMTLTRASLAVGSELLLEVRRVRGSDSASLFETEASDERGVIARAVLTLIHAEAPPGASFSRGAVSR